MCPSQPLGARAAHWDPQRTWTTTACLFAR